MAIKKTQNLKDKRILITAGPSWVPIDSVRVISNTATGETGCLLAEELNNSGAKVTLVLGPVGVCCLNNKIRLVRFKFFDELKHIIEQELSSKKYDIIIHSAAVSDFRAQETSKGKLKSNKAHSLKLLLLPKIIQGIRRLAPEAQLIPFKLELNSEAALIEKAKTFLAKVKGDYIVANRLYPYRAFLIDKTGKVVFRVKNKTDLANKLVKTLNHEL